MFDKNNSQRLGWRAIALLLSIFIAAVYIIFDESIKHAFTKYISKVEISYEIITTSRLLKRELRSYAVAEGLSYFKLNLDDPILKEYYIVKFRLKNKGIAIKDSLKFHVSIGQRFAKILDIKHKVKKPTDKIFAITHPILNVKWSKIVMKEWESKGFSDLSWDSGSNHPDEITGYNLYGSLNKKVGYGRINEKIIVKTKYRVNNDLRLKSYRYISVAVIGGIGLESGLSKPLPYPESLAFKPFFKDVVFISPDYESESPKNRLINHKYSSLTKAIEMEGKTATFLVKEYKRNIENLSEMDKISGNATVLYLDDLSFLRGEAKLYISGGLDEDAEIVFYFLCKIFPEDNSDLDLKLVGQPEIKIKKGSSEIKFNQNEKIDKKTQLTPAIVQTFSGKNSIYLFWDYPSDRSYAGVKIYRAEKDNKNKSGKPGQEILEIYKGRGRFDALRCDYKTKPTKPSDSPSVYPSSHYEPPPKNDETLKSRPMSVSDLHFHGTVEMNLRGSTRLPYYEDNKVISGSVYTYTIYAYNRKGEFSYPIIINASLNNWPTESGISNCNPVSK